MIALDENYTIKRDKYCWMLVYKHKGEINPETNKPTITIKRTYHGNIKQAIDKYIDNQLIPCESSLEILEKLDELNKNVELLTNILKLKK